MELSRRSRHLWVCFAAPFAYAPLAAQPAFEAQSGEPPEQIDILVDVPTNEPRIENCEEDQDAAAISGEIVVCRRITGDENRLYDNASAEHRHAQRTQGPPPVDVAGPGIFRGKPTISGLCFIPPCPRDPAYLIDFEELPDTPPGSDADRVGRGLAPRGNPRSQSSGVRIAGDDRQQANAEELGLPPARPDGKLSPSGSASPEAEPSD